jgi:hypothetical protein
MSTLSTLFLATNEELDGTSVAMLRATDFPGVQAKRVDPVKLNSLATLLDAGSMPMEPTEPEGDSAWLFPIPAAFVQALAALDAGRCEVLATKWCATDEWKLDRGTPVELTTLLTSFGALARQSLSEKKAMWLWLSL